MAVVGCILSSRHIGANNQGTGPPHHLPALSPPQTEVLTEHYRQQVDGGNFKRTFITINGLSNSLKIDKHTVKSNVLKKDISFCSQTGVLDNSNNYKPFHFSSVYHAHGENIFRKRKGSP